MTVVPIIHCQVEREPAAFHAPDVEGDTLTFSVNIAFEVRAEREQDLEQDEIEAEALYRKFYASLRDVKFWLFQYRGANELLDFQQRLPQVSEPFFDSNAFCDWLARRRPPGVSPSGARYRFWTTLGDKSVSDASDETRTTAFISSRTLASWDATVGHQIGVTHLVRLPTGRDGEMVVLPALVEPDPPPMHESSSSGTHDFSYQPGIEGLWVNCRTEIFDPWTRPGDKPDPIDPGTARGDRVVDPDVDHNGFLKLNFHAEELSRYLVNFEGRATTLLAATSGLLPGETVVIPVGPLSAVEDIVSGNDALERLIGLSKTDWGAAVWYATARLVGALDPWIIALMQPGDVGADVAGDALANLIIEILDALDESGMAGSDVPDFEATQIIEAIRTVLRTRCALVEGGPSDLLSRSLQHVFGISPAILTPDRNVAVDQPVSAIIHLLLDGYHGDANGAPPAHTLEFLNKRIVGNTAEALTVALSELEQRLNEEAGAERALIRLFEVAEFGAERFPLQVAKALDGAPSAALTAAVETGWAKYRTILDGPFPAEHIKQLIDGKDEFGNPWEQPVVLRYCSSRRTAIAQMSSIETRVGGRPGRIGAGLEGVYPLCKDYPRLGMLSSATLPGTLDLFRDSDGVGRMSFPAYISSGLRWTLDEIECSAETGPLHIRVLEETSM
ncbi:hypothetical protein HFO69_12520 [Rhizobium laguerreae]|uniref:hypothetical protein n=1 Tax=Rhizobium laguerreae TaxID=1076926 RepID=UPI001C92474D|nr:hypothetical protein [Rhizobium laguerreae]MBY3098525.1 hypothetical protein [Rhizobium laguerreae]